MGNILSLNQVLDITYDVYKRFMKPFIGFTLLMTMVTGTLMYVVMAVVAVVFIVIAGIGTAVITSGFTTGMSVLLIGGAIFGFWLLMIPAISILQLVAAGPVNGIEEIRIGNKATFNAMFNYSFKKFGYVLTSTMAYSLMLYGIVVVGALFYYGLYTIALVDLTLQIQVIAGIVVGLIVIVACLWIGIKGAFYLQVALCEEKHFFAAVMGSFKMVDGQFKRIFAILFSYGLSYFIIYSSLGGIASTLTSVISPFLTEIGNTGIIVVAYLLQMVMMVVQLVVVFAISPIQYITLPIIYFNERNRKYGDDLHKRIDGLIEQLNVQEVTEVVYE